MFSRRDVFGGVGAVATTMLIGASASGATNAVRPLGETIVYRVHRDGTPIGHHVARFRDTSDGLDVVNDVRLVVTFAGVPVYRYTHTNTERWRDGRLVRATARTDDNGDIKHLEIARDGDAVIVDGSVGRHRLIGDVLTTSLWHPDTPVVERLVDVETGAVRDVSSRNLGTARVDLPDGPRRAQHHRMTGHVDRELWYDSQGRLVKAVLDTIKDDSRLIVRPRAVVADPDHPAPFDNDPASSSDNTTDAQPTTPRGR